MTLLCKALVPKLPSTHPSGHWCWLCSTAVPSTRTAHLQVIPASLPGQLHSSGTSHSQLLPAHCKQHSSIVSPSGFLIRKQESSSLSEMPDYPLSTSLAPSSIRSHQSYSKHITHPHHFLSCLAADLPQRRLKGALMFFVSPFCLAAIKIKSMPPSLSWLFPLQFFFSVLHLIIAVGFGP